MEEIIKFNGKDEIHKKLEDIFNEIDKYLKMNSNNNSIQSDDYYLKLIEYFYSTYDKLKENKWDSKYNFEFLKRFKTVTLDDDINNKYINQMEYIRLYDLLKENLFKLNDEYIKLLLYVCFDLDEINAKTLKTIISLLENKLIKESIDKIDDFDKKIILLSDYIDYINSGFSPIELAVSIKNEENQKDKPEGFDDLSNGIITIDRIYKNYITQATFCKLSFENIIDDETLSNIRKINLIKNYSNNIQIKFITLVQKFQEVEESLIGRFKFMSDLIEIFSYYKEEIENKDTDDLSNILFYKRINNMNIDELKEASLLDEKRL